MHNPAHTLQETLDFPMDFAKDLGSHVIPSWVIVSIRILESAGKVHPQET